MDEVSGPNFLLSTAPGGDSPVQELVVVPETKRVKSSTRQNGGFGASGKLKRKRTVAQRTVQCKKLKDGKFGCETCDLVFDTPADVIQHMLTKGAHRFRCPVSGCLEGSRMFGVSGIPMHLSAIHKYRFLCRHAHVDACFMGHNTLARTT